MVNYSPIWLMCHQVFSHIQAVKIHQALTGSGRVFTSKAIRGLEALSWGFTNLGHNTCHNSRGRRFQQVPLPLPAFEPIWAAPWMEDITKRYEQQSHKFQLGPWLGFIFVMLSYLLRLFKALSLFLFFLPLEGARWHRIYLWAVEKKPPSNIFSLSPKSIGFGRHLAQNWKNADAGVVSDESIQRSSDESIQTYVLTLTSSSLLKRRTSNCRSCSSWQFWMSYW